MCRYDPRTIGDDKTINGGAPVVHLGVVERMLHGCDNYAPVMLPATARVLLPTGDVMPLTEEETRKAMKSAYESSAQAQVAPSAAAANAFVRMSPPDGNMAELARDAVWWRRFAYFSLLAAIGLLLSWPSVAIRAVEILKGPTNTVQGNGVSAL